MNPEKNSQLTAVSIKPRGATLIVALVILLAITLLGVASLRSGIFHERMSLNSQAETLTFLGAESSINGILSYAMEIREERVDDSFFTDAVLGVGQKNCITKNGISDALCANTAEALDTRGSGVVFAQAETEYVQQTKLFNSDPDTLAYHTFDTIGTGYLRQDLELPFATRNSQQWKMLGVAMPFTISAQHVKAAKADN